MNIDKILPFSLPEFREFRHNATKKISISGVQPKYSLKAVNGKLQLTEKNGEYILKPIYSNDFDFGAEIPANEHLTMQIAEQIFNLRTAENALVFFSDGTPAYITKRFDILPNGEKIRMEDFAQLGNFSGEGREIGYKYEFSYQKMADILKITIGEQNYIKNAGNFFKAIVFNYLINNGDTHIKNFSVLFPLGEPPVLTPFYDLLNTRLHLPNDSFMALDLFEDGYSTKEFSELGFFSYADFLQFGVKIGLETESIEFFLKSIQNKVQKINEMLDNSHLSADAKAKYKEYVADRIKMLVV